MNSKPKLPFIILVIILLASTGCGTTPAKSESKPVLDAQTAALVNGEKITTADFERRVAKKKFVLEAKGHVFSGPDRAKAIQYLRDTVIRDLIEEKVIMEEADREGIKISDQQVDAIIANIKSAYPSEEAFRETMKSRGLTIEAMRKYNRMQLTKSALQEKHPDYPTFIRGLVEKADVQINDLIVDKLFQSV